MKTETKNFIFSTPPESNPAPLVIVQKPDKGAPMVTLVINDQADVAALANTIKPN